MTKRNQDLRMELAETLVQVCVSTHFPRTRRSIHSLTPTQLEQLRERVEGPGGGAVSTCV